MTTTDRGGGIVGYVARVLATGLLWLLAVEAPPASWAAWFALSPGLYDGMLARGPLRALAAVVPHGLVAGLAYGRFSFGLGRHAEVPVQLKLAVLGACLAATIGSYALAALASRALSFRFAGARALAAAAAWALGEYVWGALYSGISHGLGWTQWPFLPLVQTASFAGIYGVTFLVALAAAGAADAGEARRPAALLPSAGVLAAALAFGAWRLSAPEKTGGPVVALLQGAFFRGEASDPEAVARVYAPLADHAGRTAELLVWPETTVPVLEGDLENPSFPLGAETARRTGRDQVFGASLPVKSRPGRTQNLGVWMSADGTVRSVYRRVFPMPFGEYLPWPLRFLKTTVTGRELEPGREPALFDTPLGKAAVTMCGETFLPGYTAALARRGADFLLNLSNVVWIVGTPAARYAFAVNVFRAVETGRSVVRADNFGPSAVIDSRGRLKAYLGDGERGVVSAAVVVEPESTPYLRWGDAFLAMCAFLLAAGGLTRLHR